MSCFKHVGGQISRAHRAVMEPTAAPRAFHPFSFFHPSAYFTAMRSLTLGRLSHPGIIALLLISTAARAQVGPDLLIKPWAINQAFDFNSDSVFEFANPSRENHADDITLSSYHEFGRWRVLPDQIATPTLGYDVSYFDVHTHDAALPGHLWNTEFGFSQPVAELQKWFVVLDGAAGYAGDTPYSDPHALYFAGDVIVGRKFSADKALVIALNYDGNRTFLPDVPLPGFAFADRYNEHVSYVIGAPFNSIRYEPVNGLQVDLGWELVTTFSAKVGWEFKKHYFFYGDYTDKISAFQESATSDMNRRLYLHEHRVEGGFRYNPTELIKFSIGGGWAFGQEFSTGYQWYDGQPLRHVRDGPFVEALLQIGF